MRKLVFFIPAIILTIFYSWAALSGIGAIHPIVAVWLVLFWIAGTLLSKTAFWGGLFGIIPATYFIYMGTKETGQIISETTIGIVIFLYYVACIYCVYKKNLSKSQ
ncbi:MAG TPA: hypothetical protein DCG38_04820 [Eubacteriaceae bacterium]|nr:hypothetical protein [Eubacteriaceae bacterium]